MSLVNFLTERGLEVEGDFVPFSKSRNANERHYSLNWIGRIKSKSRVVLSADYQQGEGHLPSYKQFARRTVMYDELLKSEAETGRKHRGENFLFPMGKRIPFPAEDFLQCIALDCEAINAGCFEAWAEDVGFDPDSRKAEAIYRTCLNYALALRSALGEPQFSNFINLAREMDQ